MRQQDRSGGGWRDGGREDERMGEYGTAVRIFGVSRQSAVRPESVRSSLYLHITLLFFSPPLALNHPFVSGCLPSFQTTTGSSPSAPTFLPVNHLLPQRGENTPPQKNPVTSSDPLGGSSPVLRRRLL